MAIPDYQLTSDQGDQTVWDVTTGNGKGQIKKVTYPSNGNVTQPYVEYSYDNRGNLYSITDRSGDSDTRTFYQYDMIDRVTTITYPQVNSQIFTETIGYDYYDSTSHLLRTRRTDINGVQHDTWTDENNRVAKIVRDGVTIEERIYDNMGNLHTVVDARNNKTKYWYDGLNRKICTEYHWIVPDESSYRNPAETYQYYPDGRLLAMTDMNDNTTVYSYDNLDRLIEKEYNNGSSSTYTYVGSGNHVASISENGETLSYTYDNMKRVTRIESNLHSKDMIYEYNSEDRVMRARCEEGLNSYYDVGYTYYDDGSVQYIDDRLNSGQFSFDYQMNGLRSELRRPNRVNTVYSYDDMGRLVSINHRDSQGTLIQGFEYDYDLDYIDGTSNPVYKGYRTRRVMTSQSGNSAQTYAYNDQGWLTRTKYVDSDSGTEAFTYDATGNRTQRTWTPQGGVSTLTSFDIADYNDLVIEVNSTDTIDYSSGGNMLDDQWLGQKYEWNHFNQVTAVKDSSNNPLFDFEYGAGGNRLIQETHSGGTTTRAFIYDREDVVVEFSNDTFSTLFRQYIHGPGIDEPLAILDGEENYIYYLHDGLGSVTGFVDKKDNLLGIYDYAAFGEERKNTISFENRYRYTSREYVNDELYYYRARYLRPDLGRFVAMDPLGMVDGTNQFVYVTNSAVMYRDPMGYSTAILMECSQGFCHCWLSVGGMTFSNPGQDGVNDPNRTGAWFISMAEPSEDDPCKNDCLDSCIQAVIKDQQKRHTWFENNCCDHVRRALSACNCKIPWWIRSSNWGF